MPWQTATKGEVLAHTRPSSLGDARPEAGDAGNDEGAGRSDLGEGSPEREAGRSDLGEGRPELGEGSCRDEAGVAGCGPLSG